ncbi:MAG TPA: tetratricopeptide repeat protein [Pyrinomonadaceae bacterium]|nr:tetratricopeptide repeat protein [Pyrinomonadaceae bacterium]
MKRCPTCQEVFADDKLNFCRNDGTALVTESSEGETAILPGYRGSAPIQSDSFARDTGPAVTTSTLSTPARKRASRGVINSLAVLPLVNVSPDAEMEYFSDGITESIINALSQLPKLRVVPRSTVFRYKGPEMDPQQIGRELGVRAVLTGRVLHFGERLIVNAELIDVANESQLWGEQYNRKPADIFEVQEEISREISQKLLSKLSGEEHKRLTKRHTHDTEAYRHYLKGRFYWNKRTEENFRKGIENFREAIELDPNYALAYAGLADSYILLAFYGSEAPNEMMPKGKAAAVTALELDDSLAEAHNSLAYIYFTNEWNWSAAEKEFKKAIRLNPKYATVHHWYAFKLAATGRHDDAVAEMKLARELDPLALIINAEVGWAYYFGRRYDKAIEQFQKTLEMDPSFSVNRMFFGLAYTQQERFPEAISELRKAVELSGGSLLMKAILGHAYGRAGDRKAAEKIIAELTETSTGYISAYNVALIYAGLGDRENALSWLARAVEQHDLFLAWMNVEPMFDSVRADPRFADLVKRIGLKPSVSNKAE